MNDRQRARMTEARSVLKGIAEFRALRASGKWSRLPDGTRVPWLSSPEAARLGVLEARLKRLDRGDDHRQLDLFVR